MTIDNQKSGLTIVEVAVAVAVTAFILLSVVLFQRMVARNIKQTKDTISSDKLVQMGLSRLKNIPFYDLFPMDSAEENFGLTGDFERPNDEDTVYSSTAVLASLLDKIQKEGFDRFAVDVTYLVRNVPRNNLSVSTGQLYAFIPEGDPYGSGATDEHHPTIKQWDENGDNDLNDVYLDTSNHPEPPKWVTEQPDTDVREIVFRLYKKTESGYEKVTAKSAIFNKRQLAGDGVGSLETSVFFRISTPSVNAIFYEDSGAGSLQEHHLEMEILADYPSYVKPTEFTGTLLVEGKTEVNADIYFTAAGDPEVAQSGETANSTADYYSITILAGNMSSLFPPTGLQEGATHFVAYAMTDDNRRSKSLVRPIVYDTQWPLIQDVQPAVDANLWVGDKSPVVGAQLIDLDSNGETTQKTSGICEETIVLSTCVIPIGSPVTQCDNFPTNYAVADHRYDRETGFVQWIGPDGYRETLEKGATYHISLQGGDFATYKSSHQWQFIVQWDADTTAPDADYCEKLNDYDIQIHLYDEGSGINTDKIKVTVDGSVVIGDGADEIDPYSAYDSLTDFVSYRSTTTLASNIVYISAEDWADTPNQLNNKQLTCTSP